MCPTMAVSQETNTTLLPVSLWRMRKARAYSRVWIPLVSCSFLPYPIMPTWGEVVVVVVEEEEEELQLADLCRGSGDVGPAHPHHVGGRGEGEEQQGPHGPTGLQQPPYNIQPKKCGCFSAAWLFS